MGDSAGDSPGGGSSQWWWDMNKPAPTYDMSGQQGWRQTGMTWWGPQGQSLPASNANGNMFNQLPSRAMFPTPSVGQQYQSAYQPGQQLSGVPQYNSTPWQGSMPWLKLLQQILRPQTPAPNADPPVIYDLSTMTKNGAM
jgi:hypothetical protein